MKVIAFAAHKNHRQIKAVCKTSFVINTTPYHDEVSYDKTRAENKSHDLVVNLAVVLLGIYAERFISSRANGWLNDTRPKLLDFIAEPPGTNADG